MEASRSQDDAAGDGSDRLVRAAEAVLADPQFTRSPTLSRLLRYLVAKSRSGEAEQLKSYTVALDGLGRDPASESPDAYARVQVGRLRKALTTYYESRQGEGGDRLVMESGSYVVRLGDEAGSPAEPDGPLPADTSRAGGRNPARLVAAVVLIVVIIGALGYALWRDRVETARWRTSNFPRVAVEVDPSGINHAGDDDAAEFRLELLRSLGRYDALRPVVSQRDGAEFVVRVAVARDDGQAVGQVSLVDKRTERLVWSTQRRLDPLGDATTDRLAQDTAFSLGHSAGVIESYSRQRGVDPETPFGCWLRFSSLVQFAATPGDAQLSQCAERWHALAPEHPIATALAGWTAANSASALGDPAQRREQLANVAEMIGKAEVLNPRSLVLRLAGLRAFAFIGDRARIVEQGREALALNGQSADVAAMVGQVFAFWNLPEGRQLLLEAQGHNPARAPWYNVGLSVAAMMADRPDEMAAPLARLQDITDQQVLLRLLFAAHAARTGDVAGARRQLAEVAPGQVDDKRLGALLRTVPIAPEVSSRLLAWLRPALAAG